MKNKILTTITKIMALVFIVCACALDSDTYIPHIICAICEVWFVLMLVANKDYILKRR